MVSYLVIHSQLHCDSRRRDQPEGGHIVIGVGGREGAVVEGASTELEPCELRSYSRNDRRSF